jgi:hypothetical protein
MPSIVGRKLQYRGIGRSGRYPIASGQTFKQGDFLGFNSSGELIQLVAAGTGSSTSGQVPAYSSGLTNLIVGRAQEDAQPSSNDPTILPTTKLYGQVMIAEPGTQFLIPIYDATVASAYPNANLVSQPFELWNLNGSTITTMPAGSTWVTGYAVRIDKTTAIKGIITDWYVDEYVGWPDIGQAAAPSTGTASQFCACWFEFIGNACALTGAGSLTRTN